MSTILRDDGELRYGYPVVEQDNDSTLRGRRSGYPSHATQFVAEHSIIMFALRMRRGLDSDVKRLGLQAMLGRRSSCRIPC